jgi:hypothetical protein
MSKFLFTASLIALIPTMIDNSAFGKIAVDINTFVARHNLYRAKHHSPNITNNSSLNSTAQAWANYLAAHQLFEHSTNRHNVGENIYAYYTTGSPLNATNLAKNAVDSWYNEVSQYNYNHPGFSHETGHFTQVVWKNSHQLGCGTAQGIKQMDGHNYIALYVVCQYAPAGNVIGQFPQNVLQP